MKELARSKGTNLKQVAEKCGIPPTTLYSISSGDTNFDNVGINTAIKVANALGITVEELYTGEPIQRPPARQMELSDKERRLVELYREMDAQFRAMLLKSAEAYVGASVKEADVSSESVSA